MSDLYGSDAYSPTEIAARVEQVGVAKARLPLLSMLMLSMLAGAFVGLGALYFVIVKSDPTIGFAAGQVLGGVVFSLGLMLVVEGLLPFLAPGVWRRAFQAALSLSDGQLRFVGLTSMIVGLLVLLFWH